MNSLEIFSNELLLDLFEYFNEVDLIHGFYGLNQRFNELLVFKSRCYYFNFQLISKKDFKFICQEYLPKILNRIQSIHLSENEYTHEQFNTFLSLNSLFEKFIQLRLLSLDLNQTYSIDKILNQFSNLNYLTISSRYLNFDSNYNISLINTIWSLSKLKYCTLENVIPYAILSSTPIVKSNSLRYLILDSLERDLDEFAHLCEYTPNLQYFELSISDIFSIVEFSFIFQFLNKFKLIFDGSLNILTKIFQSMPNLKYLIIYTRRIVINGYEWEQIIEDNLSNLKTFQFLMEFNSFSRDIDELFQSFQTQFWFEKHQWSNIEYYEDENKLIHFYSLPCPFEDFYYETNLKFQSTCPENKHQDRLYSSKTFSGVKTEK